MEELRAQYTKRLNELNIEITRGKLQKLAVEEKIQQFNTELANLSAQMLRINGAISMLNELIEKSQKDTEKAKE